MNRAAMWVLPSVPQRVLIVSSQEDRHCDRRRQHIAGQDGTASAKAFQIKAFVTGRKTSTASERAGVRLVLCHAGNSRFFTYVYQQRLGVLIDWFWVLNSADRDKRFARWGMINDPECCKPGDPNCPAKSYDETYGFDYCPGDEKLLQYVGKTGYRDPACDFIDAPLAGGRTNAKSLRLRVRHFHGQMGIRKFPNPRFNADQWRKVNDGTLGTWAGYNKKVEMRPESPYPDTRMLDGSIARPSDRCLLRIMSHRVDPLKPPRDPKHPITKIFRVQSQSILPVLADPCLWHEAKRL